MAKLARLPRFERSAATEPVDNRVPRLRTRYYAFLSYSHKDKELADWLHRELERFRVPSSLAGKLTANGVVPRRLTPIFRDQHDLSAGDDLAVEIEAALAASQFLVILCSPMAAKSRWTNLEIESFKRTRPEGCVLAAVAAGEPFASDIAGREDEECFPPALRYKYDRRGHRTTKRAEPLAADFREGGEGRRLAFLKLVAGMLGVGLDELVQRDQTRRQRRLAILATASLAGMAVTSTLAVTAIQARDAAREQRRQAEGLIAFMVGDLRDKLEPIGKLDVLDGVGSRVLAYYSKQDTSDLSDDALLQRSRALNLMGEVAFNRGNPNEAEQLYRQATAGTAEAVRRSPNDTERIFDHAQNVFWVGEAARFAGRPGEAEAAWREYKRLADQMTALEPDNLKYRMEVLYANEDVGISLYYEHRFAEAAKLFQSLVGPMQKLASLYPQDTTYLKELATMWAWVADSQRSRGNFDGAVDARRQQISALEQLLTMEADSDARSRLISAHEGLGNTLADKGDKQGAIAEFGLALGQAEELIPIEPRNAQWKSMAADSRLWLALTLLSTGQRDTAALHTDAACLLAAGLPTGFNAAKTRLGTNCSMTRARLALAGGATDQAFTFAQQALASAKAQHSEDPISDRHLIANVYCLLGDIRQRAGDSAAAATEWSAGLSALPQNVAERPFEMNIRLGLLRRLGRAQDAAPIAAHLSSIGYHGFG
ncbi:MAG TPA: toll/interleukin-1 receptor domain-containing protein [Sphingomicrobium sp.]|nr:toll/interleukin-1 receptor domain-containing protein [Sphingomicrobium sp.]